MLLFGVVLAVAAILLIVLGIAGVIVHWMLWIGVGLIVVAGALILANRLSGRRYPEL